MASETTSNRDGRSWGRRVRFWRLLLFQQAALHGEEEGDGAELVASSICLGEAGDGGIERGSRLPEAGKSESIPATGTTPASADRRGGRGG